MPTPALNLALETSGRVGSVALGRGDALLGVNSLGEPRRHNLGLMPAIDAICRSHGVGPRDLGEVYVSLGPGSFTGLRVGIATAKMLALATRARLVGVATLDVLAAGALLPPLPLGERGSQAIAVGLNLKRGTLYSAVYLDNAPILPPALRTLDELLADAPRPLSLIVEKLPDGATLPAGVTLLPPERAVARADVLWRLGRQHAAQGLFLDPAALLPLYVREPEAVTLWNARHGESGGRESPR